jgi:hypothetical protein
MIPGCSGDDRAPSDASTDIDGVAIREAGAESSGATVRSYAPTYDAIWNEILLNNCLLCHASSADYLVLPSEVAGYRSLVGAQAQGPDCAKTGLLRVEPHHPERSLLYLKVTSPPCGDKMPPLPGNPWLGVRDVAQIRLWIECGAPDGDAGCDAEGGDVADALADVQTD